MIILNDIFMPISIRKSWYFLMLCDYKQPMQAILLSYILRLP